MVDVKYPEIEVQLTGRDGNAAGIIGRVIRAMRRAGVDIAEIADFIVEATASDYDHLLQVCMKWVEVN